MILPKIERIKALKASLSTAQKKILSKKPLSKSKQQDEDQNWRENEEQHRREEPLVEIKGHPDYVVADNCIYNRKTNHKLKRILKNGMVGYYLNGKFVNRKNLEYQRPKSILCPF